MMNVKVSMIKSQVLFLCTGNSCRSQMAEAIVNAQMGERYTAFSSGTYPAGYVHPNVIQVLGEIGIEHQGRSKHVNEFQGREFDLIVTVCDSAAEECPIWLGSGQRIHCSFADPVKDRGNELQVLAEFRRVRDKIAEEIPTLLLSREEQVN
jgi:arsenate reductase